MMLVDQLTPDPHLRRARPVFKPQPRRGDALLPREQVLDGLSEGSLGSYAVPIDEATYAVPIDEASHRCIAR
jgi:hypothetical protein